MRVKLSIACAQNSGSCGAHRSSCKRDRICASADAKATLSINTRFRVTTCRIWSNGAPSYCSRSGNCRVLRMLIATSKITACRLRWSTTAPIAVNHQGQFPSVTLSFNLAPGIALSDAVRTIRDMEQHMGMPGRIHGSFSGTLQAFQASLASERFLILAALAAIYIVLGILYESYIHPITI